MNTGLQDAIDLSWKLEASIQGWRGEYLLDSYQFERKIVALRNIGASTQNFNTWVGSSSDWTHINESGPVGDTSRQRVFEQLSGALSEEWRSTGVALGYRYETSPIIAPDNTPEPLDEFSDYVQTARPGHRAPHAWLADGRSTIDLVGRAFVLLRFGIDPPNVDALVLASAERGMPLIVVDIVACDVAKLYERKLVLVRPDGHTARRADDVPVDSLHIIDVVRGAMAPTSKTAKSAARLSGMDVIQAQ